MKGALIGYITQGYDGHNHHSAPIIRQRQNLLTFLH